MASIRRNAIDVAAFFAALIIIYALALKKAEAQTTYNMDIIFQRGIPDTSLRYWGAAIAGVGDVNGDGYDDVAVGCFRIYSDQDTAKVFVYYGAADIDTVYYVLISDWSGGHDGLSICGGNINGDDYSDLILSRGKVYVHYGSAGGPSITPDITFGGRLYESYTSVACGDLNGDDTTDLIVGDYWNRDGNGHVNIYLGSAAFDTMPWLVVRGKDYEALGRNINANGDINSDGYNDLSIGAMNYNVDERGRVYIYHGGPSMDTLPDWWKNGEGTQQYWGEMGCPLCSVNSDYDQLWTGSFYYPGGYWSTRNNGKAVLFNGGNPMDSLPDMTITGVDTFTLLGTTFATSLLDSNLRGDYICGSLEPTGTGMGKCWTSSSLQDSIMDGWLTGRWPSDMLGVNIENAGDVNNDGIEEVIFGSNADTNRIVVICKYTGLNGVEITSPIDRLSMIKLLPNTPNPFNKTTTITYQLTTSGRVTIKIFNIAGQAIKTLVDGYKSNGMFKEVWNGRDEAGKRVSSGAYFIKLQVGECSKTGKMLLIN
jgi:hypothetical protein